VCYFYLYRLLAAVISLPQVLRCTTRKLDAEYLVGVRAMFGAMNTSGSGSMTLEELTSALDRQGCKVRLLHRRRCGHHVNVWMLLVCVCWIY
jgi:hypothetical protein